MCVCVRVCACVRACVRACVCVCVRVCVRSSSSWLKFLAVFSPPQYLVLCSPRPPTPVLSFMALRRRRPPPSTPLAPRRRPASAGSPASASSPQKVCSMCSTPVTALWKTTTYCRACGLASVRSQRLAKKSGKASYDGSHSPPLPPPTTRLTPRTPLLHSF